MSSSTLHIKRVFTTQATEADQMRVTFSAESPTGKAVTGVFVFSVRPDTGTDNDFVCVATLAQLSEIPASPADIYGPVVVESSISSGTSTPCASCSGETASAAFIRRSSVTFVIRRRDDADSIGLELMDRVNKLLRELDADIDESTAVTFLCDGTETSIVS